MALPSGGPQIDFRGGRIDAPEGGPAGVPQPEESLQSHTAAFARMGFTPTEMIELVACGHTIGSVQSESFPQIVSNTTTNPDGNAPFDSSPVTYDNHV
jgi:catalase (peroxidase I)